jgi:selenocysteine lyase/cysteine desulfurase
LKNDGFAVWLMEDLRKHFPALARQTYLNTPATGLLSRPLAQYRAAVDTAYLEQGHDYAQAQQQLQQVREIVARFFGASEAETALVPNFSFGINTILEGLPSGQKILLLEDDYPSVNWPVETRDFNVCYAKIDENLEQHIEAAVAKHHPDVFLFSITQWKSGIKIDMDFLHQLKAYHPNMLLIADGTQYLGTERFHFYESPLDVIGASAYKWLLSGFGTGFFLVREAAQNSLFPATIGFNSAETFNSTAMETRFMKHFEPGHLPVLNHGSLGQSLTLFEDWGTERIFSSINSLAMLAKDRFVNKGLLPDVIARRKPVSPIFTLRGDEDDMKRLKANGIIASLRGDGIRVGFHCYNTEQDVDALLEIL